MSKIFILLSVVLALSVTCWSQAARSSRSMHLLSQTTTEITSANSPDSTHQLHFDQRKVIYQYRADNPNVIDSAFGYSRQYYDNEEPAWDGAGYFTDYESIVTDLADGYCVDYTMHYSTYGAEPRRKVETRNAQGRAISDQYWYTYPGPDWNNHLTINRWFNASGQIDSTMRTLETEPGPGNYTYDKVVPHYDSMGRKISEDRYQARSGVYWGNVFFKLGQYDFYYSNAPSPITAELKDDDPLIADINYVCYPIIPSYGLLDSVVVSSFGYDGALLRTQRYYYDNMYVPGIGLYITQTPDSLNITDDIPITYLYNDAGYLCGRYHDRTAQYGTIYTYREEYLWGYYVPVADEVDSTMPDLNVRTYPNPFASRLTISLQSKSSQPVDISIYNTKGQKVRTLATDHLLIKGTNDFTWDGLDSSGTPTASGIYFLRSTTVGHTQLHKLLKIR